MRGTFSSSALLVALAAAAMLPGASSAAAGQRCANEALRTEQGSVSLPDCRAYEMVSPVEKNGGDVVADGNPNRASIDGNAVSFGSRTGFGDTTGSGYATLVQYVANRSESGWQTHAITPTPAPDATQVAIGATIVMAFSGRLDRTLVEAYALPQASPAGVQNEANLYVQDTVPGAPLQAVTVPAGLEEVFPTALTFSARGASSDLGAVVFETRDNLVTGASGEAPKLYVSEHGALHLAGVLPGEAIPPGGSSAPFVHEPKPGLEALERQNTVSRDGSRILFVSPADGSAPAQLYMRKDGTTTVRISEEEGSTPDPEPQEVLFQTASPDHENVVFATTDRLLDADPGGEGYGIYLYRDSPDPSAESNLTFIARSSGSDDPSGGELEIVKGMSEDGSRVYFESHSTLYMWEAGNVRQVAPAPDALESEAVADPNYPYFRVSADGQELSFVSPHSLTASDTGGHSEMYVWDASAAKLSCASCPTSGQTVTSAVETQPAGTVGQKFLLPSLFATRFLSSDGSRLLFSTAQALVPQDSNGLSDVYEYDVHSGQVHLVSPGAGDYGSWLAEASPSGDDVFILTRQSLSRWDTDTLVDLYDARVGGGLPEPPPPTVGCAEDECQGTPSAPPSFNTASAFSGLGNVVFSSSTEPAAKAKRPSALAKRLAACKRKPRRQRARCRAAARRTHRTSKRGRNATRRAGR